jgi:hypothetical protein
MERAKISELNIQFCFDVVLRLIPSQCIKMIVHPREAKLHDFQPALEPVETQQQDCGQVIKTQLGREREGLPLPICRRHSTKYEQWNGLRSPRVPRELPTHFLAKLLHVNLPSLLPDEVNPARGVSVVGPAARHCLTAALTALVSSGASTKPTNAAGVAFRRRISQVGIRCGFLFALGTIRSSRDNTG